jgi:hypothetical protein
MLAEWQIVRARLLRTRLGLWLGLLAAAYTGVLSPHGDLGEVALRTGLLAAVLSVAFAAGADLDRAALRLSLAHPTHPLAVAAGRWLGATVAAGLAVAAATFATALLTAASPLAGLGAAAAGVVAAGAAAACALPLVLLGGNVAGAVLLLYLATLSALPDAVWSLLEVPAPARVLGLAVLRGAPGLWRYQGLSLGEGGAWLHAIAWTAGGVGWAALLVARRR